MQQIVNVTIDESGRSIADSKSIGLQYETGVAQFVIAPDPSWVSDQYFYYLIVSPPEDSEKKQYAVPLVNQGGTFVFKISSGITWTVGNYKFAFIAMSKELTDGRVPSDGIVSISTAWNCKIEKSILDYVALQSQPEDANFQLLYTDLMALSVELRNAINNIELEGNYARKQGDEAKKQADYAKEQGDYAKEKGDYANTKAELANTKAEYANTQGYYAKTQGEQAQTKGNKAQEQGNTAEEKAQYATEQGNYAKRVGDTVQGQIDRLRANQVQGSASGKEIVVEDSAEMESVLHLSGNSEQDTRSGKNKFDYEITTPYDGTVTNKITKAIIDGKSAFVSSPTADTSIVALLHENGFFNNLVNGTKYNVSFDIKATTNLTVSNRNLYINKQYCTNTLPETITTSWQRCKNTFTFNSDNGVAVTHIYPTIPAGTTVYLANWQIEEGTVATDYEPYGVQPSPDYPSEIRSVSGDVEVKVEGKNILKIKESSVTENGVTCSYTNNTLTAKGTGTLDNTFTILGSQGIKRASRYYQSVIIDENNSILLKAGTYIISIAGSGSLVFCGKLGDTLANLTQINKGKPFTITEDKYLCICVYTGPKEVSLTTTVQLERGSVATEYEPYKGKTLSLPLGDIELRSTPDGTRDTFERVDGVWNKVENVGSVIIDGSELWWGYSSNNKVFWNDLGNIGIKGYSKGYVSKICNRFKYHAQSGNNSSLEDGLYENSSPTTASQVVFHYSAITTVEDWKTWLSNNPTQIDYVLAEPTYTPITDQALISALDELEQLILHKGYNYITATSVNGVKAQLDLSYYKDINAVLNNITAMIATIGGELNV